MLLSDPSVVFTVPHQVQQQNVTLYILRSHCTKCGTKNPKSIKTCPSTVSLILTKAPAHMGAKQYIASYCFRIFCSQQSFQHDNFTLLDKLHMYYGECASIKVISVCWSTIWYPSGCHSSSCHYGNQRYQYISHV